MTEQAKSEFTRQLKTALEESLDTKGLADKLAAAFWPLVSTASPYSGSVVYAARSKTTEVLFAHKHEADAYAASCGPAAGVLVSEVGVVGNAAASPTGDVDALVKKLDTLINGPDGAAKQASLCDIVAQVEREGLTIPPAPSQQLVETASYVLGLIDKAGLQNLASGVQLGSMSWAAKMNDACQSLRIILQTAQSSPPAKQRNRLAVWFGPMPESNGKLNWTVILHNGDVTQGITLARSEYTDRVRYEADRVRWLLGDLDKKPFLMDYDVDLHSGYREPPKPDHVAELSMLVKRLANLVSRTSPHAHLGAQALDYLKRHNLTGSTLREGEDHESS